MTETAIYLIAGRVRRDVAAEPSGFHVLLAAADDEAAIRRVLQALAAEGYGGVDIERLGEFDSPPTDEPYRSAWQSAQAGEIAIVLFEDPFGEPWDVSTA